MVTTIDFRERDFPGLPNQAVGGLVITANDTWYNFAVGDGVYLQDIMGTLEVTSPASWAGGDHSALVQVELYNAGTPGNLGATQLSVLREPAIAFLASETSTAKVDKFKMNLNALDQKVTGRIRVLSDGGDTFTGVVGRLYAYGRTV